MDAHSSLFQDRHSCWKLSKCWVSDFQDQFLGPCALRLLMAVVHGGNSGWILCALTTPTGPAAQTVTVGWFEQLLSWAMGKCCIYIAALFSLEGPSQEHKLVFLDMTMVAEDRFSLLHTSQAVGMSVAGQLSKPKMLELRQVWERVTALIDDSKQCLD